MSEEIQFTNIEDLMLGFLETSHAQRGTTVLALLLLQEDKEKQLEMCNFLSENPEATDMEIMRMAYTISGKGECPI